MSKSQKPSKKKNIATAIGAAVSGATTGFFMHKNLADQFARDLYDPESKLNENYQYALAEEDQVRIKNELNAETEDSVEQLIHGQPPQPPKAIVTLSPHAKETIDRYDALQADQTHIENGEAYQAGLNTIRESKPFQQLVEAEEGLRLIEHEPHSIVDVHFYHEQGTPMARVVHGRKSDLIEAGDGSLAVAQKSYVIPGIEPPKGLNLMKSANGIFHVHPQEIEGLKKSQAAWLQEAKATVAQSEKPLQGEYAKLFRKAAPRGWCWERMGSEGRTAIIGAGVVCAVVGGLLARSLIGNHQKKEQQRQAEEAVKNSPFAGF